MFIQFQKDTYLRKSPAIRSDNILDIARIGEYLEVEADMHEGDSYRMIAQWYRDLSGRYCWAGEVSEVTRLPPSTERTLTEQQLYVFEPQKMNLLIEDWEIISRFWQKGIHGRGIRVAILSTGMDVSHPDLKQRFRQGYNFVNDNSSEIQDEDGEGTAIAGLIAGEGRETIYGLTPKADLYIAKVAEQADAYKLGHLIDALYWALDLQMDLIYVGAMLSPHQLKAPDLAAFNDILQLLHKRGVLVVAPNAEPLSKLEEGSIPATLSDCLAVVDLQDLSLGERLALRGLAALGKNLLTLDASTSSQSYFNGPKAAAAAVVGLLALLGSSARKEFPDLTMSALWHHLKTASFRKDLISGYLLASDCVGMIEKIESAPLKS